MLFEPRGGFSESPLPSIRVVQAQSLSLFQGMVWNLQHLIRLGFVKAAVAFVPSQKWGPHTGVKQKHCISISQLAVSARRPSIRYAPVFALVIP